MAISGMSGGLRASAGKDHRETPGSKTGALQFAYFMDGGVKQPKTGRGISMRGGDSVRVTSKGQYKTDCLVVVLKGNGPTAIYSLCSPGSPCLSLLSSFSSLPTLPWQDLLPKLSSSLIPIFRNIIGLIEPRFIHHVFQHRRRKQPPTFFPVLPGPVPYPSGPTNAVRDRPCG